MRWFKKFVQCKLISLITTRSSNTNANADTKDKAGLRRHTIITPRPRLTHLSALTVWPVPEPNATGPIPCDCRAFNLDSISFACACGMTFPTSDQPPVSSLQSSATSLACDSPFAVVENKN